MAAIDRCHNIEDIRRLAARRVHPMVFGYIDGGAGDEETLKRNVHDFEAHSLAHRVLTDVSTVDTTTTVFGESLAAPFFFSPSAGNRLFHTEGEAAVAKVAAELGIAYSLSTLSSLSIEEVAAIGPQPRWFQLYAWKDRGLVREMIARAREAGYSALILTVDHPLSGNRERDARAGFSIPPKVSIRNAFDALRSPAWLWDYLRSPPIRFANLSATASATTLAGFVQEKLRSDFTWRDAEWVLGEWAGNGIIKGVVHPDDARTAIATGFRGIMVSNHGGRQLDGTVSPIGALTAIRQAIGGDVDVVVDGGIRRGKHILKALALGATAVSFARPYLYGLCAAGTAGVRRSAAIFTNELRLDMALAGVRSISEIDSSLLFESVGAVAQERRDAPFKSRPILGNPSQSESAASARETHLPVS